MRRANKTFLFTFVLALLMSTCACSQAGGDSLPTALDALTTLDDITDSNERLQEKLCGDYRYTINSDDTVKITRYLGSERYVEIPAELEGKVVTSIGTLSEEGGAFHGCTRITEVIIPEGIQEIQDRAFANCAQLVSVKFPASVRKLGTGLLEDCRQVRSVYFEGDAPDADRDVFSRFFRGLTVYYYESASGWSNPWNTYTAKTYGDYLYEDNGNGTISVTGYQGNGGRAVIPAVIAGKKVTVIGASFMEKEQHVSSVAVPDGVVEIQDSAFRGALYLKDITVPASVTHVGKYAFADCPELYAVYFDGDAPESDDLIFAASPQATAFYHAGTAGWALPWNGCDTKTYGEYQYKVDEDGKVTLTRYVGPGGDIQIPSEIDGKPVTSLGVGFMQKDELEGNDTVTSVTIPEGVIEIQDNAFQSCPNLKSVKIPASMRLIMHCAFDNCPALRSVYFEGDAPQTGNFVFGPVSELTVYHRMGAKGWSDPWYDCPTQVY